MDALMELDELGREVLFSLPVEPIGLSLEELADGILGDKSPAAKGGINLVLGKIGTLVGLIVSEGPDAVMYSLPRREMLRIRASRLASGGGRALDFGGQSRAEGKKTGLIMSTGRHRAG